VPIDFAAPVTARYLRIVADKPDDWGQRGDQMAISGVAAYASSLKNVAERKPAQALFVDGTQADLQPGSLASSATDGNPATFTQATGRYRWISQVDLGRATSLNLLTLLQPDSAYATAFHVDASLDGSSFVTVARRIDASGGLTPIQLDRPISARYLRVIADRPNDGGQTGGQMAVSEIGAY
jgi:F5/8 type C domain